MLLLTILYTIYNLSFSVIVLFLFTFLGIILLLINCNEHQKIIPKLIASREL
jgi:hypothetical protein